MPRIHLYNGHLRGPLVLTPVVKRLAVELSRPVIYDRSVKLIVIDFFTLSKLYISYEDLVLNSYINLCH